MKNFERAAAIAASIDGKIRVMGGDNMVVDAAVKVGLVYFKRGHSGCRSIENGVAVGSQIIDGGASC